MRVTLLLLLTVCSLTISAQNVRDILIDESANGKPIAEFLVEMERKHGVDFIFNERKMKALTIVGVVGRQRLVDYLDNYLSATHRIVKASDKIAFLIDKTEIDNYGWSKENYIILKETNISKVFLEGKILDGKTDEPLVGAQIFFQGLNKGTLSDVNGYFRIDDVPKGILLMDVKFVGYEIKKYIVAFSPYSALDKISTTLFPESKELQSITVTAEKINENVLGQIAGIEKMNIETIKSLPTFLGEVNPIRSLTTLPGVSTTGELASGFNVRGGESGQNLILQDGATIYNPSHLFGFFSAFNPDMVRDVTLYKGGGPANFGGRISSVLDVSLKNGDARKTTVTGGVGLVSSRLAIQGPILKDRSSYMIGGRISYCNWLVKSTDDIQLRNSSANFWDVTGKLFQTINTNNSITLSVYSSYDAFNLATDSTFSWGTFNTSLKWDHTFNDRIFSTLNLSNSNYYSEVRSFNETESFTYHNAIKNYGLKYDLNYQINEESKIIAGLESIGTMLEPGELTPDENSDNNLYQNMNDQRMIEGALYVQGDFKFSEKWSLSAGMRYSHFLRLGKDDVYAFDYSDIHGRYPTIEDTISYSNGQLIKSYGGLEPRLSIRYLMYPDISLKLSYYRGFQYLHLISNTTSTTPQDYWVASGPHLKPQIGNQFSLGYFQNMKDNLYEFSIEGFYKEIDNTVDYIEGADITLNPALEAGLSQGRGLAYGVEFFFKKTSGRFNGWLSYTYSRSLRKFSEQTNSNIEINDGKYYPSTFDQPNIFNVVMNYRVGKRSFLSANFNYSTGRPITIPISKFSYDVYLSVLNYSQRNEYRIPDYHRLDISFTIKEKPGRNNKYKDEWVFSVFNIYSRNNAYSISFDRFGNASKLSVLGSIFPSITYNFSF